ncbi:4Fe-4S dicluster domain-containing protein [Thauera linaloolentis]|uniref:Ferredoxin n=1 Tax=Thauera linaloolentis (strain DSM 12138 / JCM 21573 / CCUG 41526 / CIP 105981 / IAM 15112 / NBRC 102519 / 47Lol) TaxID=1123367 RepID=N6YQL8_THAL4|nr:ferredoxin family protein [Thauera linaloolentis]ENO84677.1 ferredoxin [Thauera linaloolentis 47Lol = DSM 12138]MCM8564251.1 ferredoxin family protein [Thauera linaloolentis]
MIELILDDRCIRCDKCVQVCPNEVFDALPGDLPAIARQAECHTCFLCEVYCPTAALYVSPYSRPEPALSAGELDELGLIGSYVRNSGWAPGARRS